MLILSRKPNASPNQDTQQVNPSTPLYHYSTDVLTQYLKSISSNGIYLKSHEENQNNIIGTRSDSTNEKNIKKAHKRHRIAKFLTCSQQQRPMIETVIAQQPPFYNAHDWSTPMMMNAPNQFSNYCVIPFPKMQPEPILTKGHFNEINPMKFSFSNEHGENVRQNFENTFKPFNIIRRGLLPGIAFDIKSKSVVFS